MERKDRISLRLPDRRCRTLEYGFPFLAWLAVIGLACVSCGNDTREVAPEPAGRRDEVVIQMIGGLPVRLELAITEEARIQGLKGRQHLDPDQGMLFIYSEPKIMSFWMKDTLIPLSIAFVEDDGTIRNIEEMRPNVTTPPYLSKGLCRYAIEMNKGWFAEHGVEPGDCIAFTSEILSLLPE